MSEREQQASLLTAEDIAAMREWIESVPIRPGPPPKRRYTDMRAILLTLERLSGEVRRMEEDNAALRTELARHCSIRHQTAEGYTCIEMARVQRGIELCAACAALAQTAGERGERW